MRPRCPDCSEPMAFAGSTQHDGKLIEAWVCNDCGTKESTITDPLPCRHAEPKLQRWIAVYYGVTYGPIEAYERHEVGEFLRKLFRLEHLPPGMNIRIEE